MLQAGDGDSLWRLSIQRLGKADVSDTAGTMKTVEKALEMFESLWERQAVFEDDIPPPGFEDAVRKAWASIIEGWEY